VAFVQPTAAKTAPCRQNIAARAFPRGNMSEQTIEFQVRFGQRMNVNPRAGLLFRNIQNGIIPNTSGYRLDEALISFGVQAVN
jgi:hypothetical protein